MQGLAQFLARPAGWWSVLAALCLLLLAPLLLADMPPILDYPNHLARLFILAHAGHDKVLDAIWQPHWAVIPDLAIDLVGPELMRVLTPVQAGKILLALALLMPLAGAILYSRAAFGARLYWPMTAGLMAYNLIFVLGFLNYLISLGGALMCAALWLRLRGRPTIVRAAAGAMCASALFFTHLLGMGFFALLVGAAEAGALMTGRDRPTIRKDAVRSTSLLALTFVIPAILWTLVPRHGGTAAAPSRSLVSKLFFLPGPFEAYQALPGILVAVAFFGVTLLWLAKREGRAGPGIPIAIAATIAAILILPFAVSGGTFIDSRVPPMLALLLAAGICPPHLPAWLRRSGAALLSLALVVEICQIGAVWQAHETPVAELRASIAAVPPGSKVLAVTAPYARDPPPGMLALGLLRTDRHLPALLVLDRQAFWPLLFSDPSQHPIVTLPPYAALAGQGYPPDVQALAAQKSLDPGMPAPYLENWPAHFDFVLVLNAGGIGNPAGLLPDTLQPVSQTGYSRLYKVRSGDNSER